MSPTQDASSSTTATTMTKKSDTPRRYRVGGIHSFNLSNDETPTETSSTSEPILSPTSSLAASSLRLREDLAPFMELSIPAGDPFGKLSGKADTVEPGQRFKLDLSVPPSPTGSAPSTSFASGEMLRKSLAPFMELSVRS
ncbi:hypothetical protein KEM54_005379 [Ascosphaera aggregata]|nr:hypothetical protein KEM54_005379 [Ascosphaera aggregata]